MEARKSFCSNLQTNERIAIADGAPAECKDDMDARTGVFFCAKYISPKREKDKQKGNFLSQQSLSFRNTSPNFGKKQKF
jgi:hypothetical protein